MLLIKIQEETLDMIEKLNNGVRPEIEIDGSFFVYNGPDAPHMIISPDEALIEINEGVETGIGYMPVGMVYMPGVLSEKESQD